MVFFYQNNSTLQRTGKPNGNQNGRRKIVFKEKPRVRTYGLCASRSNHHETMWLSSLDIFFSVSISVPSPAHRLVFQVFYAASRLHSGMRFDSWMSTYNRFQDCLFSRRYSLYGCVDGFKKTEKKRKKRLEYRKQKTERRLKCFRLCRYLLSGKWTLCSSLFLILFQWISLYFSLFLFLLKCLGFALVVLFQQFFFGYVDDLVIFPHFTPFSLSKIRLADSLQTVRPTINKINPSI